MVGRYLTQKNLVATLVIFLSELVLRVRGLFG